MAEETVEKWIIWTRWPNDRGWVKQPLEFDSPSSADPEKLLLQLSGYAVKVLKEGEKP